MLQTFVHCSCLRLAIHMGIVCSGKFFGVEKSLDLQWSLQFDLDGYLISSGGDVITSSLYILLRHCGYHITSLVDFLFGELVL